MEQWETWLETVKDLPGATQLEDPRANLGAVVPLYNRLQRNFQGNPVFRGTVTSTGIADQHQLPANADAMNAHIYVSGGPIVFRVDGSIPSTANDEVVAAGSFIELSGYPTIQQFWFAASSFVAATLFITYFD
jgi:hypothetical protein